MATDASSPRHMRWIGRFLVGGLRDGRGLPHFFVQWQSYVVRHVARCVPSLRYML